MNQAVKRNISRFPEDFMFQLSNSEWELMRSNPAMHSHESRSGFTNSNEEANGLRSQIVTLETGKGKHRKYLPYAFTEQGIAMLSGVLRSEKAIKMNIAIMRAFVAVRKVFLQESDIREQLKQIKERVGEHDSQLSQIYDALENLLDEKAATRKWNDRERIGFKK